MNILIACEQSQIICNEFRKKGHNAYSCDLQPGKINGDWHFQQDIFEVIQGGTLITQNCSIVYIDKWDMMIAHPPCERLTKACQWMFTTSDKEYNRKAIEEMQLATVFFMRLALAPIDKIAIENPPGTMSKAYKPPTQYYNPYNFKNEKRSKRTGLWLKNLPPLKFDRTEYLSKEDIVYYLEKTGFAYGSKECKNYRAETPIAVAQAMAEQWG